MSNAKPHIKPKAEPYRPPSEPPLRDPPTFAERDPPVFEEWDAWGRASGEERTDEHVLFREDDCLR